MPDTIQYEIDTIREWVTDIKQRQEKITAIALLACVQGLCNRL
jgi:hypothetical protein